MSIWPADDDAPEPEPMRCPGCGVAGDAPCVLGCVYAEPGPHVAADAADIWHDEQASSDRDTPDPWADIF